MTTNKARLANFLVDRVKYPIDTASINEIAGIEGTRRLRELREEGWNIKHTREGSKHFYTLVRVPAKKLVSKYV